MTQTHDAETVERVAFLRSQHEQSCFELGEHPLEYDTPYSAGADALERLSALPPQEVSVQEAALPRNKSGGGWVLDTDLTFGVSESIQNEGWDCTPEAVELAMLAAERALSEGKA